MQVKLFPLLSVPKVVFPILVELQLLPSLAVPNVELPIVVWLQVDPVLALEPNVVFPKIGKMLTRDDIIFLAITFDVGHEMTRRLHHSKALVEAHLFRWVSSQSEHFPKNAFLAEYRQTETPIPPPHARPAHDKTQFKSNHWISKKPNQGPAFRNWLNVNQNAF